MRIKPSASMRKLRIMSGIFITGLGMSFILSGPALARSKNVIYNTCACFCDGPTGGGIIDIRNSGGFSCGAYNNKTCNYEDEETGGIRSGTTKWCGGFKPDGVKAMTMAPLSGATIQRRGVEGDQPSEPGPGPYGPTDAPGEAK